MTAKDAFGNTANGYTKTLTLSIKNGTGHGGANLTGCTSSLSSGVTTFAGCAITTNGTGYELNALDVDGHQFRIQRDERDHRHQDGGR